ncbi:glia-derived nexin [Pristis pectinata]|uniref:glia-derived nexin n=1 Tax=Pristis pectinata TaxID=685728 RepID=UPI00223E832C|nr:glia-derived nexin [Pristis pectinata]XP_051874442.1 glia-derived nexin [Pristis pectinata]XP_051874443.1 glia-derived nexin [Pristis pectinata]
MRNLNILILLCMAMSSVHCQRKMTKVSEFGSDLGMKIFNQVVSSKPTENIIMSPHGIASVLWMLHLGADGRTKQQLSKALKYSSQGTYRKLKRVQKLLTDSRNQDIVTIANGVFVPSGFEMEQPFIQKTNEIYQAVLRNMNFADPILAASIINQWTANQTRGMITDLISPAILNEATRLVIVNAIFFKGLWKSRFLPENTQNGNFYAADGNVYQVPLMFQRSTFNFGIANTPANVKYYILEMPYHGGTTSMFIALPENIGIPLSEIAPHINAQSINNWKKIMTGKKLEVSIPRFTAETETNLEKLLLSLGITDMFDEVKANFRKINRSGLLYVSQVLQKAKIEVNEDGTKASAATAAVLVFRSFRFTPPFTVNRPFLYIVWHNPTGTILFIGQVSKP